MRNRNTGKANRRRRNNQQHSRRDDTGSAKSGNQRAGDKARRIHRHHMKFDGEIGLRYIMPANLHGERGRRHHKVHQSIGDNAANDGGDETRHANNFA